MRVIYSHEIEKEIFDRPVLSLGNFDGVHLGHQDILRNLKMKAEKYSTRSVVHTFEPHPLKVIAPHKSPMLINSLEEEIALIDSFGIDLLICSDFTAEFAKQHPEEFVKDLLVEKIGVREVIVGHDYAFGKGRAGNTAYLRELGEKYNFNVTIVSPFKVGDVVVSSSVIRKMILEGNVREIRKLLGRNYSLVGEVKKGAGRGECIGFPTANIHTLKELIPKRGVYAVYVKRGKRLYKGVMNIGFRPTFNSLGNDNNNINQNILTGEPQSLTYEVHILDLKENLYGELLETFFVERLRGEEAFKSSALLTEKIKEDVSRAEEILKDEDKVKQACV